MSKEIQTIKLGRIEYVVLPKAEYLRLRGLPPGTVDAVDFADRTIAANLKRARESAGLTQEELAAKLGKSQTMVSGAESGRIRAGERYIASVLKACGLPQDWPAKRRARRPDAYRTSR